MTNAEFTAWRECMGWTKVEAAKQLDISIGNLVLYERGTRFDNDKPVKIPKVILLATEALTYRHFS